MPPRKKGKSAPPVSGIDRMGALPDYMLQHVLSFLPAQAAVRTCMLARRWRDLWRSTRGLRIVGLHGPQRAQYLRVFVEHLLILRKRTDLDTVKIKFDLFEDDDEPYLKLWTRFAVMCKVRALTIHLDGPSYLYLDHMPLVTRHLRTLDLEGVGLDEDFVGFGSCSALEELKMDSCEFTIVPDLKHRPTFSKLKTLLLNEYWCEDPDMDPLAYILKNSPVLEKLILHLYTKGSNHKVEMKGNYSTTQRSSVISEHLNIVELRCNVVDENILKVLRFMSTFNIRFSFE
ncbi:unnamed protein product [Alopecurus aequalis]